MNSAPPGGKVGTVCKTSATNFLCACAFFVSAVASISPARADQIIAFDYSLPGTGATPMAVSASGYFITTDLNAGTYNILDAFGTWNGVPITGVLPPGTWGSVANPNDNVLNASGPALTYNGVAFSVNGAGDQGTGMVNLFYDASQGGYTELDPNVGGSPNLTLTPVTPYQVLFNFSYSIPGCEGDACQGATPQPTAASGVLSTFYTYGNNYFVTGVSGSWNGTAIQGILEPGSFGGNDNLLTTDDPHLTSNGLSFALAGGTGGNDGIGSVNLCYFGGLGYTEFTNSAGYTPDFNLSAIPEPSSWMLIGVGIVGIAGLRICRKLRSRFSS
jgi:hypothetical protein